MPTTPTPGLVPAPLGPIPLPRDLFKVISWKLGTSISLTIAQANHSLGPLTPTALREIQDISFICAEILEGKDP